MSRLAKLNKKPNFNRKPASKEAELAQMAERAAEINEQIKHLDKILSDIKKVFQQEGSGQYGDVTVLVTEKARESFSWSKAKQTLSADQIESLMEFVSLSEYKTVQFAKK